jgi:serine protease Do
MEGKLSQMDFKTTPCRIAASVLAVWAALASVIALGADATRAKPKIDRVLAVYVPQNDSDSRIYIPQLSNSFAPGKALEDAALDLGRALYREARLFNGSAGTPFNLVLVLHPRLDAKDRDTILTVHYKLLDAGGRMLLEGSASNDMATPKLIVNNAFYPLSMGVMKDILKDDQVLAKATDPATAAQTATAATFDRSTLVSREKPARSGTGFFINERGQIMTAAHVVHDCPLTQIKIGDKTVDAKLVAESVLLDLAVVDSGAAAAHVIPLRAGTTYELGEEVTNIGYPLDGLLAGSPNVTRGNVSSRGALAGSEGQFQFSAPVQPGSSGGPVVSSSGELIGVTVGTLGINGLIQKGVLPQNVNFALDARYVARFMDRSGVPYLTVAANRKPDGRSATEISLPAVVQLICYQ